MRNYFNSMKKVKFSLFFLLSVFGLCAQSPILVLEAENADSIHSPARVKSGDGFSNGKYVGGNDRGSYLFFHNVKMEKAGTYEFKTYFNCNGVRRFTVKVNNYPEVECTVNGTAKWDTPPAETAKVLIYLAAGTNTIKITPYPTTSGGPNLDKFEILETSESPLPVPQEGFPIYNPQIQISEKSQTKRLEIADSRKTKRPITDKRTTPNKRHSNAIITL